MKLAATTLFLAIVGAVGFAKGGASENLTSQVGAGGGPRIGFIKQPFCDGCGCLLHWPSDKERRAVLLTDMAGTAQMYLDGTDLKLRLIEEAKNDDTPHVGQRFTELYEANGIKLKVEYEVTEVCPPEDEGCEVTTYSAWVTVTQKGRSRRDHVAGTCGC